jgi:hypothetical protein
MSNNNRTITRAEHTTTIAPMKPIAPMPHYAHMHHPASYYHHHHHPHPHPMSYYHSHPQYPYPYPPGAYPSPQAYYMPASATSSTNNKNNKKIQKKKRKTKKNKIIIPMGDMIRLLTLPQPIAAQKLKVSVSTLKRRYYELELGRWPANCFQDEVSFDSNANDVALKSTFHQESLSASEDQLPASVYAISLYKEPTLRQKEHLGTLLNLFNIQDSKYLDQMTTTVLSCAFSQNITKESSDDSESTSE